MYVYRPFKSHDLEPEIMVLEIDAKEKFVEGASLKSIKCEQIIEVPPFAHPSVRLTT